jgi:hypothetical protein
LSGRGELAFVEPAEMESFIAAVSKLELDG